MGTLAVSGEFLALSAPIAVVGPLAGVFVDRWDKRRTMLAMDMLRALIVSLLIALATPLGDALPLAWRLAAMYFAIAAASICSQFFGPARLALLGDIAPVAQQARASSLMFMTLSVGVTLGPALAAPLYVAFGPIWALALNALSFLISFGALRRVVAPPAVRQRARAVIRSVGSDFIIGLRFFFRHPALRTLLIVTALTLAGSSAINALGIFFLTHNLHSSPDLYGALSAATGLGVLVGSTLAIWLVPRLGPARSYWLNTIVVGGLLMLYARETDFVRASVILFILGLPSAGLNVAIRPLHPCLCPSRDDGARSRHPHASDQPRGDGLSSSRRAARQHAPARLSSDARGHGVRSLRHDLPAQWLADRRRWHYALIKLSGIEKAASQRDRALQMDGLNR